MNIKDVTRFLADIFPQAFPAGSHPFVVERIDHGRVELSLLAGEEHLRPGGTVSGPAMMTLADLAMYVLVLSHKGPEALVVTTNLNINFLRKPPPGRLVARANMLKMGRSLAVGDVTISGEGEANAIVAHATVTYSIPPEQGRK